MVHLYTYTDFEHECSLCRNELKPIHSYFMITVNPPYCFTLHMLQDFAVKNDSS